MIKIRLEGLPDEVQATLDTMRELYVIHSVSKPYANRNSNYVRVYLEIEPPTVL